MKGLVGKWMWMDGLGMKNRTNGLNFLLVGCFDLASLHSLYSYVFFSLLLFVLCSGIVYIYQDCCSSLYTAMTCHSGDSFDYEDSYLNIKNQHHPSFLLSSLSCLHLSPFRHASANCTCLPPEYLSLTLDAQSIPIYLLAIYSTPNLSKSPALPNQVAGALTPTPSSSIPNPSAL